MFGAWKTLSMISSNQTQNVYDKRAFYDVILVGTVWNCEIVTTNILTLFYL